MRFFQSNPPCFYMKFGFCQCITALVMTLVLPSLFVSSRDLFFSFDSLSHLDKILKSPKIRSWRLEAGNRWRKWNESILHLYSSVEQVRFGINLNSKDAYRPSSTLYLQNSFHTLYLRASIKRANLPASFNTLTVTKLRASRFDLLIMHALWFLFIYLFFYSDPMWL